MTTNDQPDLRSSVVPILSAHGFLPEKGHEAWISRARKQYAIAGFDDDDNYLRISMYRTADDELAYETCIDLRVCGEDGLERIVKGFDLSVFSLTLIPPVIYST